MYTRTSYSIYVYNTCSMYTRTSYSINIYTTCSMSTRTYYSIYDRYVNMRELRVYNECAYSGLGKTTLILR